MPCSRLSQARTRSFFKPWPVYYSDLVGRVRASGSRVLFDSKTGSSEQPVLWKAVPAMLKNQQLLEIRYKKKRKDCSGFSHLRLAPSCFYRRQEWRDDAQPTEFLGLCRAYGVWRQPTKRFSRDHGFWCATTKGLFASHSSRVAKKYRSL